MVLLKAYGKAKRPLTCTLYKAMLSVLANNSPCVALLKSLYDLSACRSLPDLLSAGLVPKSLRATFMINLVRCIEYANTRFTIQSGESQVSNSENRVERKNKA